uniref:AT-hook motif nuclear-localized protein 14-like n=1 Tax=Erigeron canadensis TaxID=72917 RepID=UPI001CB91729|nr:AT-hook motif nuclear-localized protein 14-like [Erigeron canadensis]
MEITEIDRDPSLFPQAPPSTTTTTTTDATTVAGRKRGRPRKYNSPEEAVAAKKLLLATKKQHISPSPSATANNSFLGNDSNGFTLDIINVTTGEDINHKIMSFVQQSKQEICIMSASGVVSSASIGRPDAWGSKITYRGSFDIISLCGSYVHADGESRTGGLSICMSGNKGQIVGGGVGGPLIAAGLVQVIVGTFVISSKKTVADSVTDAVKDDASVVASVPNAVTDAVKDNDASVVASVLVTDTVKDHDASVVASVPNAVTDNDVSVRA